MAWFRKFPGISLFLLLLTYGVEGWLYGAWATKLLEQGDLYIQFVEKTRFGILYGIAVAIILFCVIIFTSPISLIAISIDNWLKSDTRAFLSIFLGAFAFTLIVQKVDYFARFIVFVASALLLKLDLQLIGFNRWLCSLILTIFCWLGFTGGILAFYMWS
ncbi:hypothetical protein I4641_11700 [Waterburya agarophytonicola K14]|uniref:Uncharacterized protein n=1 Tax=Waterburya agarophytonicola KI4 TaxID=2874699 RepID=A0A964FG02_9CYAN|nr:hypothetical protein [Waterburya agarophytonicola]MCC0177642.1 hypothetical protein [Waterburya agarophytonicola KI4]